MHVTHLVTRNNPGMARHHRPAAEPSRAGTERVRFVPDGDGRGGWTMLVDGVQSSHVDLADPTRLDFEYMRSMGDLLDSAWPRDRSVRAAHLGGAGCTLPGYLAATRPGSRQVVFEVDAEVLEAARAGFALRSTARLRLRLADGRAGLASLDAGLFDVVVRDAFAVGRIPRHLCTRGFLTETARVLAEDGIYLANLADPPPLRLARAEVATALAVFGHVALAAEPAQFKGRRYGNLVLAASRRPLPEAAWARRLAGGAVRARLLTARPVRDFAAGAAALEDLPANAGEAPP